MFVVLTAPAPLFAAGLTLGDNGAVALSQGGAFAGQADDLSAVRYNPAGLTQLRGLHFLVDGSAVNHSVSFQRSGLATPPNTVRNTGGPFLMPFVGVGYGLELGKRPAFVGLAAYGPSADGRYKFPLPKYDRDSSGSYVEDPAVAAPQRYSLISSDMLVAYPSLAVAYQPHRTVSLGASLQVVVSKLEFVQAVNSALHDEVTELDSIATVRVNGTPALTAVVGAMVKPTDRLSFGVSFRPPVPLQAKGTLDIKLGEAASNLGSSIEGNQAEFFLTLPMELKAGVCFRPTSAVHLVGDFVLEGWESFDEFLLYPDGIAMRAMAMSDPEKLAPSRLTKKFKTSLGGRVGGGYRFSSGLSLRGGVLFEQGAPPDERTNIDFLHFTRALVTAGAGYELGPVELVGAFAFLPEQKKTVTNSEARLLNTNPGAKGEVVGNGAYTSSGWVATVGVRGHFEGLASR